MSVEAMGELLGQLRAAPDTKRSTAEGEQSYPIRIITYPHAYPGAMQGLDQIVVHVPRALGSPARIIYEVPSQGLSVVGRGLDNPYAPSLNNFISSLPGDAVEVDTSRLSSSGQGTFYWDSPWKDLDLVGGEYTWEIYPAVLNVIQENLDVLKDDHVQVVDIFGGDGEFAKKLSDLVFRLRGKRPEVHVIDASARSLEKAKELLGGDESFIVHPARFIVPDDSVFQGIEQPPELVTAIGGLCDDVISRREALGIAERVYGGMAEGGLFILAGKTGILLNSEDFSRIGFKVKQMSIPKNVTYFQTPFQLYVLEK